MMYQAIKQSRESKWYTQEEVANRLDISRQTYARIESGDSEITLWQAVVLAKYLDITLSDITWEDTRVTSNQEYDIEQYKAILTQCIKFGSDKDGKITKTKLAKLAYLIDFGWFYENLELLTGLSYRKLPLWPVPDAYFRTLEELQISESIVIELKWRTQLIENIGAPSEDGLSMEQIAFIRKVCEKWKWKNTEEIVRYTHEQLPWMVCNDGEIIPYSLITQEEPTNVY
jgi:transcriptional regulator with XRE-family HTH domain